jgi:alcohol dehydrogenase class IV
MLPRVIHPSEMVIKKGSLIRLKFLKGKKAAILCGGESFRQNGFLEKLEGYLKASKLETVLIDGIKGDPTEKSVEEVAAKLREANVDWVIGAGGGAVMDTAKVAWALYEYPEKNIADFKKPFSIPPLKQKAKLCLIPTTAGTGSEVSNSAVVKVEGKKIPLLSADFVPEIAILDPTLLVALPPKVTAFTALDAFTHAVESYCSKLNNGLTDTYATSGAKLLVENLEKAIESPSDVAAREKLLYGSMLAGVAQGMTSVGGVHALSHAMASRIDLTHGHANGIFLVPMLKFNAEESPRVVEFLSAVGLSDLEGLEAWVSRVFQKSSLSRKWGEKSSDVNLGEAAEAALKDVCALTNPRKLTAEGLTSVLDATR